MTNPFIQDPDYFDRKITAMWITGKGPDGEATFVTHGEHATLGPCGRQGVWNAEKQVKGIWDSPIKTTWKTGAFQDGSEQKAKKWLHRDMDLGFHITETRRLEPDPPGPLGAEENESHFRGIFAYDEDEWDDAPEPTTFHLLTDQSGERKIDMLMHDTPDFEADQDPIMHQYFNLILKLRAGQPFWYEYDLDGRDPALMSFDEGAPGAGTLTVTVSNPTDQPMRHKWSLTRGVYQMPDFSWRGGKKNRHPAGTFADRRIPVTVTDVQGGAVISLDKAKDLMIRDLNYTNMVPTLGGKLFSHVIPPYTQPQTLTIPYTDAPAGGCRIELWQPRRWSRPWGLE